jgi:hypothetical protein
MINQKLKICSVCEKPSVLWKSTPKLCKNCAMRAKNTLVQTESGKEATPFKAYRTAEIKKAKSLTADQTNKKVELDIFFKAQAELVPLRCLNCNRLLNAFNAWAKKCVTAHILPKVIFESVAANMDNVMFLGCGLFSECNCHADWDNRDAEARKQMSCYPIALSRVELFYDELTPKEQVMADKYLGIELGLSKAI